jgi:MATE family multidrug resistance protein
VELAAVGLAGDVFFEFMLICMGVVSIVSVLVAQAQGAGDSEAASRAVRQGFWVATLLSVPGVVFGWYLATLFGMLGQDERVVALAREYLHAVVWAFLPGIWFVVLRNFVTALSRAGSVMVITIAAVGLNLALNYALVFGKFGLPALGVAGAGYGTTIVSWAMFGALAVHIVRTHSLRSYRVFHHLGRFELPVCREILRLGLPVAGLSLMEGGMFMVVALLMGLLGVTMLAANQIVLPVIAISFVCAVAIGEAAAVRVAYGIGSNNTPASRQAAGLAFIFGGVVMGIAALVLWTVPEAVVSIFIDTSDPANEEVIAVAALLAGVAAVFQIFDGMQAIAVRALRGLKDTVAPMWIAGIGYWVFGIGGAYLFCFGFGLGGPGLWWGLAMGLAVTALLLVWRFNYRMGEKIRSARHAPN